MFFFFRKWLLIVSFLYSIPVCSQNAQGKKPDFPINPSSGLICICDSVKVGEKYSTLSLRHLIFNWGNFTAFNSERLFGYNSPDRKITLGFDPIYAYTKQIGKSYKAGWLTYKAQKGGKIDSQNKSNGGVRFNIVFGVSKDFIVFEITDLFYGGSNNEMAKFEDPKILGPDGVHFLSEKQRPWDRIKKEFYDRLEIISRDLKRFLESHYQAPLRPIRLNEHW